MNLFRVARRGVNPCALYFKPRFLNAGVTRQSRRGRRAFRVEQLERRDLLAGIYTVLQPVFLDGLGYTDPEVHNRVAGVTTWNSQVPIVHYGDAGDGLNSISPNTVQSSPLINLDDFRADGRFAGIDGSGFATVILDTGIDLDHPYFGPDLDSNGVSDRIVYSYDFADGDANASDNNGHGSNVSSIVASSDGSRTGMSPGADIIHLKVFTDAGGGNFSYVESALQWVIANAATFNIASVNMSLGDTQNHATAQSLYGIYDELSALAALDVIVASSSGNSFFNFSSAQGAGYPAADPNSLSVGAVFDGNVGGVTYGSGAQAFSSGPARVTPFSQRSGTLTDIMAPGAPITGANQNGGTVTMHGTSQASPHIAGIAALAQDLADQILSRRLTPVEFKGLLQSSATTINDGDDEDDNVTNTNLDFPLVDVFALGEAILALQPYGVDVSETGGGSLVVEGGTADTYSLKLRTAPQGAVQITATADAQTELSPDGTNFSSSVVLSFTDTSPQTISIRAIDDTASEGDHQSLISHAITSTADPTNYPTSMSIDGVNVTVLDNELNQFLRQSLPGGLVSFSTGNSGALASSSDQRDFNLQLEVGQTLAVSVQPELAETLSVQLVGISPVYTAPAAGQAVITPPIAIPSSGAFTLRVTGSGASNFNLDAWLNTALEMQSGDTADGSELAIDNSFVALSADSGRYAVEGLSAANYTGSLQLAKTNSPGSFIDISGTGTSFDLSDDGEATITSTVGNSLLLAGQLTIGNNGALVAGAGAQVPFGNVALPTTEFGQALVPFWDDLDDNASKEVYWEERLVGGINTLIVQWHNRPHWSNSGPVGDATFQIQLFDAGPIQARYAYQDVNFGNAAYDFGASATIGYQADSTSAQQFSFNSPVLANGDIIDLFYAVTPDVDEYEIDLTGKVGSPLDIILHGLGQDFGNETLELLDTDGTSVLATAVADPVQTGIDATNVDLAILNYLAPADGIYTLRLTSSVVDEPYSIVVTDSLAHDIEPNNIPASDPLRSLDAALAALGYVDAASDPIDYYEVALTSGQSVTVTTETPFDSAGDAPDSTLNPEIEVIHPDGSTIVASDQDSAPDGKNATTTFTAPVTGVYRLRVKATTGTGQYQFFINRTPSDINLDNDTINENSARTSDALVGNLSSSDADPLHTHSYDLVSGAGDVDNASFEVVGDELFIRAGTILDFETKPTYYIRLRSTDNHGGIYEKAMTIGVNNLAEVSAFAINDGGDQRSMITKLTVRFDQIVTLNSDAFTVLRRDDNSVVSIFVNPTVVSGRTEAEVTFQVNANNNVINRGLSANPAAFQDLPESLADGNYQITINGAHIVDKFGSQADIDQDGSFGGIDVIGDQASDKFFRMYGDSDGDTVSNISGVFHDTDGVNNLHFAMARNSLWTDTNYRDYFDYDGDGDIDGVDNLRFAQNRNQTMYFV